VVNRFTCPVSLYKESYGRVTARDASNGKYRIHPWKFVEHHEGDLERITNAWHQFIEEGHGRWMSMPKIDRLWRAIIFFIGKRWTDLTKTEEPPIFHGRMNLSDIDQLLIEEKFMENIPPEAYIGPSVEERRRCYFSEPCYWCGMSDHSAMRKEDIGQTFICPLGVMSIGLPYEEVLNAFTELYHNDNLLITNALNHYEFQGVGWYSTVGDMAEFRRAVLMKCEENRNSWTFKRGNMEQGSCGIDGSDTFDEEEILSV